MNLLSLGPADVRQQVNTQSAVPCALVALLSPRLGSSLSHDFRSDGVGAGVEMFKKTLNEGQAGDNVGLLLRGVKREDVVRGQACPANVETICTSDSTSCCQGQPIADDDAWYLLAALACIRLLLHSPSYLSSLLSSSVCPG